MIAFVEGKIAEKEPTLLVIDVNGVGYQVNISLTTFSEIKSLTRVKLFTYLHVKEDSQTLFGFFTREALKLGFDVTALEISNNDRRIAGEMNNLEPQSIPFEEFDGPILTPLVGISLNMIDLLRLGILVTIYARKG